MANPSQLRRASLVAQIALLTTVVAGVCGCSKAKITDKSEINKLIDSLANHNQGPKRTRVSISWADYAPLFADDYDWNEDRRVREVIKRLEECDREALWSCLAEHFEDDRYALAFSAHEETTIIASVGRLCRDEATHDLEFPYQQFGYGPEMIFFRDLKKDVDEWYAKHSGTPLYKQQIEICEATIRRLATLGWPPKAKAQIEANIKAEIETLERTMVPVFSERLRMADGRKFNTAAAKEIKKEYLERKRLGGNPDWPPSQ